MSLRITRCNMTWPVHLLSQKEASHYKMLPIFCHIWFQRDQKSWQSVSDSHRGKSEACFLLAAAADEDEWGWRLKQIFSLSGVFVPHQGTSSHTHLLLSRPIITKQKQRTHEMNNRWLVYKYVPFGLRVARLFISLFTRNKNNYSSYLITENVSGMINQFTDKVNINFSKTEIAFFM